MFPPDLPADAGRPWKFGKRREPQQDSTPSLTSRSLHWTVWAGVATVLVAVVTVSAMGLGKFQDIAQNHQKTQDRLQALERYQTDNTQMATERTKLVQQIAVDMAGLKVGQDAIKTELDRMFFALQDVRREQGRVKQEKSDGEVSSPAQ